MLGAAPLLLGIAAAALPLWIPSLGHLAEDDEDDPPA